MKNKIAQDTADRNYAAQVEARVKELNPGVFSEQVRFATRYLCDCGDMPQKLRDALIPVALSAHGTTFIEDYDPSPDGLGLSRLARFAKDPETSFYLQVALKKLTRFGGYTIPGYVQDFAIKNGLTSLVSRAA